MTHRSTDELEAELSTKTRDEVLDILWENIQESSLWVARVARLGSELTKPIYGGVFGHGGFVVASVHYVLSGLHQVTYYVKDAASGLVVSMSADTQPEALAQARSFLQECATPVRLRVECERCAAAISAWRADEDQKRRLAFEARWPQQPEPTSAQVRSIPRRRRQIFEASGGKCHYCATPLELEGKWHVEHKMPKALGGGDEPGNLVASCAPCNFAKRDTTDVEFKAKRRQSGGT